MDILPFVHVFKKCLNKIDKPNEIHNDFCFSAQNRIPIIRPYTVLNLPTDALLSGCVTEYKLAVEVSLCPWMLMYVRSFVWHTASRLAIFLLLDLEELGHVWEIFLIGFSHLLLCSLWIHNLQPLTNIRAYRQSTSQTHWCHLWTVLEFSGTTQKVIGHKCERTTKM